MLTLTILLLLNLSSVSVQEPSNISKVLADFDGDGDVDQGDYGLMQVALGEPHMPFSRFDLNMDGSIDTLDAEEFCRWQRKAK